MIHLGRGAGAYSEGARSGGLAGTRAGRNRLKPLLLQCCHNAGELLSGDLGTALFPEASRPPQRFESTRRSTQFARIATPWYTPRAVVSPGSSSVIFLVMRPCYHRAGGGDLAMQPACQIGGACQAAGGKWRKDTYLTLDLV
jgi:hypothetical protein